MNRYYYENERKKIASKYIAGDSKWNETREQLDALEEAMAKDGEAIANDE